MSVLGQVTVMVLTYDEEVNIGRTLAALAAFPEILVIDSGSTDATLEIVDRHKNARVVHRPFDDFASQCNFGLTRVETPWVLSLDADYELSPELVHELRALEVGPYRAYEASFTYCVYGRPLRGTLYPPRRVLYRKERAVYRNEGHGHRVQIDGLVGKLRGKIRHDDRKPLSRWLASQQVYAAREVDYLLASEQTGLRCSDRIRLKGMPAPIFVFFYTLVWRGCLLDGWPGWLYVLQRTLAETLIALEMVDRRLGGKTVR